MYKLSHKEFECLGALTIKALRLTPNHVIKAFNRVLPMEMMHLSYKGINKVVKKDIRIKVYA